MKSCLGALGLMLATATASFIRPATSCFVAPARCMTLGRAKGGSQAYSTSNIRMSAETIVQEAIRKPAVVFSKTYCPFCTKAKETMAKEGAKFDVLELDVRKDGDEIQKALAKLTGRRTVPNVFIGGKSIGGGDDTVALSKSGKLKSLLQAAGAL